MTESLGRSDSWAVTTAKRSVRLGYWTAAWVATTAVATFGPIFVWDFDKIPSLIAVLVNLTVGLGLIEAHRRYLLVLDELQRKVQLEAMGLALGVGLVVGLVYSALDITNLIAMDAEIGFLVLLIGVVYGAASVVGRKRYQ